MKNESNKIYVSSDLEEFHFVLNSGDLFLSLHHPSNKVMGIYFKINELDDGNLKRVRAEALKYFGAEFKKIELKIIGTLVSINKCTKVFLDNDFLHVKRVIRDEQTAVIFIPSQNRVRVEVSKEKSHSLNKKIKILIVDDSKTIRTILKKIFLTDPMFEVIGLLERPSDVDQFISENRPDVITLDIHMPEMDGVTLLKKIYPKYKIPCVMISSISLAEGPMVFDALEHGAVDYIQKPESSEIEMLTPVIIEKIKMAAAVKIMRNTSHSVVKVQAKSSQNSLVVIGSSTGGTEALRQILTSLPDQIPPVLIVQHIPAVFSQAFAKRMNDLCSFEVLEAKNGDEVRPNRVLIAPGGKQMKFVHKNGKSYVEVNEDPPVNRFRPSVDYLFNSVANNLFCHTIAVILTGMGKDGAREMLNLKNKGVLTIAQSEESCVVFGMPKEAINLGAAIYIEHLSQIAERITISSAQTNFKKVGNE